MEKIIIKAETFTGFYESVWEYNHALYEEKRQLELEGHSPEEAERMTDTFDADKYKKDVTSRYSELYVGTLNSLLDDYENITKLVQSTLKSPQYYNYSTDEIFIEIETDSDKFYEAIERLIQENYAALKANIKKRFTSRDGYWSFLDNDFDEWDVRSDPRMLSYVIGFLIVKDCGAELECDWYYQVDVCLSSYIDRSNG